MNIATETPVGWRWLATFPSTNGRIGASILMALATGFRVVGFGWNPPVEWLGFLTLWAGLDGLQFLAKRTTDAGYVAAKQGIAPPAEEPPKQPEI